MSTLVATLSTGISRRPMLIFAALATLVVLSLLLGLGVGALPIAPDRALAVLASHLLPGMTLPVDPTLDAVIWQIRVPRTLLGLAVGASLATAGALFQGMFRNPLADPGLLGITLGAAASVSLSIVLAGTLGVVLGEVTLWLAPFRPYLVPIAAFVGSLVTTGVVVLLGGGRRLDVTTLLLAGIAVNAVAGAITGLCIFLADDAQLRDMTFWTLGGLGGATWPVVFASVPALLLGLAATPSLARTLDCLLLGDAEAAHLGVRVHAARRAIVGIGALLVGVTVAAAGSIGFVGLVVPHLVRLTLGPGHRLLLPASALLGAALLVLADVLARTVVAPAELPIGVLTTLLGGPFFLGLLLARRRRTA